MSNANTDLAAVHPEDLTFYDVFPLLNPSRQFSLASEERISLSSQLNP